MEKTAGESGAAGKLRNKWVVWLKRESLRVAGCVFYSGLRGLRWKNLSVKQREGAESVERCRGCMREVHCITLLVASRARTYAGLQSVRSISGPSLVPAARCCAFQPDVLVRLVI